MSSETGKQSILDMGAEYWRRLMAFVQPGHLSAWEKPASGTITNSFELMFYSVDKMPVVCNVDHIVDYFKLVGLDCMAVSYSLIKKPGSIAISVVCFDAAVWLLEMRPVEICGQLLATELSSHRVVRQSLFTDLSGTSRPLTEEKFRENLELVREYKEIPKENKSYNKSYEIATTDEKNGTASATKVLRWGDGVADKPQIFKPFSGRTIVSAACGHSHSMFLTDTGQVFTSGEGMSYQIGNGYASDASMHLVKLPGDTLVRQIACGSFYCVALTESNNVFYWGTCKILMPQGTHNIMLPKQLWKVALPTLYEDLKTIHIEQIASGAAHMLFLTRDRKVLSVGSADSGRLGRSGPADKPLQVEGLEGVEVLKINCGYAMSAVVTPDRVYVWGRNDNKQCGMEGISEVLRPTILPQLNDTGVTSLECGYAASYALTSQGLFFWDKDNSPKIMPYFRAREKTVHQIATGMYHSMALAGNGEVYTWGRSMLGQCGHGDTHTYVYPTRVRISHAVATIAATSSVSYAISGLLRTPLSQHLEKCFNNKESYPDIVFNVNGTLVYAHRAMLVARCHHIRILDMLLGRKRDEPWSLEPAETDPKLTAVRPAVKTGVIPATSPTKLFDPLQVDYTTTMSNLPIEPSALLAVLYFVYTDLLPAIQPGDHGAILELCKDFGLPRLRALISCEFQPSEKSSYLDDLDALVPTPAEFKPQTNAELLVVKNKNNAAALVGAFSDLTFTASETGERLYAHRFLLWARSEYFEKLFAGGMIEAKTREVSLFTDTSTCLWLLRFLYTDQTCTFDVNVAVELLKLGEMLQLHRLVFLCSRFIEKELDDETTLYMYHLTTTHNIKELQLICWSLMVRDWSKVVRSQYWKKNLTEEERKDWNKKYTQK